MGSIRKIIVTKDELASIMVALDIAENVVKGIPTRASKPDHKLAQDLKRLYVELADRWNEAR